MAQRLDFWTHGVATILESPELAKLVQHRGDVGTVVEQDAGTSGWFHIPIPTYSFLQDATTFLRQFYLAAKVNQNARVDKIHVRLGKAFIYGQDVMWVDREISEVFGVPDKSLIMASGTLPGAGITLCVHVTFLTGTDVRGRVEFYGAGAAFA